MATGFASAEPATAADNRLHEPDANTALAEPEPPSTSYLERMDGTNEDDSMTTTTTTFGVDNRGRLRDREPSNKPDQDLPEASRKK